MMFAELLRKNEKAIVERWIDGTLASYPRDAQKLFKKQKDQFANPIGKSLRVGLPEAFRLLLAGADDEKAGQALREIVKIRAVQQFTSSEALAFVFLVKEAVRAELGEAARNARFAADLAAFDARVDRLVLAAVDVYVQCREQVFQLRVNEAKRQVSWVVDKMNQRGSDPDSARSDSG